MNDMAGWIWPLVAVAVGLALGIVLGAMRLRGPRGRNQREAADSALPGEAPGAAAGASGSTPQQRLLERLRAANLQLSAQLKSVAEANSRQAQEREQERQGERLRHERELEELREKHASELSHLMGTLVEQVDGLNKQHTDQLKQLEAELDRARQEGRRHTSSSPASLGGGTTRPLPMATPAPARPAAAAGAPTGGAVPDGPPSDYSVTLPMESFKER